MPLRQQSLRILISRVPHPALNVLIELLRLLASATETGKCSQEVKQTVVESWAPLLLRSSEAGAVEVLSYAAAHFEALSSLKADTCVRTENRDGQVVVIAATTERLIELALNPHYKGTSTL